MECHINATLSLIPSPRIKKHTYTLPGDALRQGGQLLSSAAPLGRVAPSSKPSPNVTGVFCVQGGSPLDSHNPLGYFAGVETVPGSALLS